MPREPNPSYRSPRDGLAIPHFPRHFMPGLRRAQSSATFIQSLLDNLQRIAVAPSPHSPNAETPNANRPYPINRPNSSSFTTRTPSERALSSLLPASSPANTKSVLPLTLAASRPPWLRIKSAKTSRDWLKVPVITHVVPSNRSSTLAASSPPLKLNP